MPGYTVLPQVIPFRQSKERAANDLHDSLGAIRRPTQ